MSERSARDTTEITPELVAQLGRSVGLRFPEERLPLIAARLREMHEVATALDILDRGDAIELADIAPAGAFDPAWEDVPE